MKLVHGIDETLPILFRVLTVPRKNANYHFLLSETVCVSKFPKIRNILVFQVLETQKYVIRRITIYLKSIILHVVFTSNKRLRGTCSKVGMRIRDALISYN
jgi:hypothetical protein